MFNTLQFDIFRSYSNSNSSDYKFLDLDSPFFLLDPMIDELNSFNGEQSSTFNSAFLDKNLGIFLNEEEDNEDKNEFNQKIHQLSIVDKKISQEKDLLKKEHNPSDVKERKLIFQVNYRIHEEKDSLFNDIKNDSASDDILNQNLEKMFTQRKRFSIRRPRKENQDNIRKKIKRGFLNQALIGKLNVLLKNNGSRFFLAKFPQHFVCDVNKKVNQKLLNMTLEEIFETKELYKKELENYNHNLKVVKSDDVKKNEEFQKIMNKKYYQLFEEYLNSKEFKIDEIDRLKKYKMKDYYIKKYIFLSRHFIEYFSN